MKRLESKNSRSAMLPKKYTKERVMKVEVMIAPRVP
jgi:hypothetical protein